MTETKPWASQAYLDALRPDPGWVVRTAILASYSADLGSIGAALLALAGRDDDRGSGSRTDLAEAVEQLRDKVRIVIQRGRLARLKRLPTVAGILDRFLAEVPFDETERSWHPKIALVRFDGPNRETAWRLWIGSRNLTAAENLDVGLLLTGARGTRKGHAVDGVGALARQLAERAYLPCVRPERFAREVAQVRWTAPEGIGVRRVWLSSGNGAAPQPECPACVEEVVLVSPFLSPDIVRTVGSWGDAGTRRTLLSTQTQLRGVAGQLRGFSDRVLAYEGPLPDDAEPVPVAPDAISDEQRVEAGAEVPPLGLHAKILAARSGKRVRLWVGSANATKRAWHGKNAEVIAELEATPALLEGIEHALKLGRPVTTDELAPTPEEDADAIRERLDCARNQVAGRWSGQLLRDGDMFRLVAEGAPHPVDAEVAMEAGLATSGLLGWPRGEAVLGLGSHPLSHQTELVQIRLSLEGQECVWLQRCTVTPPLDEGRDRAALARHLGARAFLEWIRALLQDTQCADETEEPWDRQEGKQDTAPAAAVPNQTITLEDMLSSWARDRHAFTRADERMRAYLELIIAETAPLDAVDRDRLTSLRTLWDTLRAQLLDRP
ncbi:phospholipase D family protein [Azospirillum sp. BE72]|uniref:phospholipase D family protein n=1 Tax=Azospirillum sp. BE72 TaxID=2817776 RepID=UPI00285F7821|nr:phospholipase D family protein [Azospirillum sp. BE72]MDR6770740.1 hypothetical protein [Azospirillum sp. BE72]